MTKSYATFRNEPRKAFRTTKDAETIFELEGYGGVPVLTVKVDPETGEKWVILHNCAEEAELSSANAMWSYDEPGGNKHAVHKFGRPLRLKQHADGYKTTILMMTRKGASPVKVTS